MMINFEKLKHILERPISFVTMKGAMEKQIHDIKTEVMDLENQVEKLVATHQAALDQLKQQLTEQKTQELAALKQKLETNHANKHEETVSFYQAELEKLAAQKDQAAQTMQAQHQQKLATTVNEHEAQIKELKNNQEIYVQELQTQTKIQVEELKANHEAEVEALTNDYQAMKAAHEAQVTELQTIHETQLTEVKANHEAEVTEYQTIIEQKAQKLQQQAELFAEQENTYATAYQKLKTEIETVLTTIA
ncbi:MAG: hypothetical protein ACRDCC_11300 [Culicoidibacterales bacterium]